MSGDRIVEHVVYVHTCRFVIIFHCIARLYYVQVELLKSSVTVMILYGGFKRVVSLQRF